MNRVGMLVAVVLLTAGSAGAAEEGAKLAEQHLQAGTLAAGETALEGLLKKDPRDDQARFALGALQFVRSVEGLSQSLYRHGALRGTWLSLPLGIPGGELPLPDNPDPQELSYEQARKIVADFASGLERAEATLAKVESESVKLPLHFGLIRLDFDGDGKADEEETLWKIYARLNRGARVSPDDAKGFVIAFDAADVYWLRGYCHLLMTLCDVSLAYDWRELLERAGHVLFPRIKTQYPFLKEPMPGQNGFAGDSIADVIAFIHLLNFPVAEPKRMESALRHLEAMTSLSRKSWELILKETDNDHEWIPSPRQTGVIPNVGVTQAMVDGWKTFLAEVELILKGERLIPFWRGNKPRGINLRKVFTAPRPFDLVLWVQGTAAAPYLEEGQITDPQVWQRLMRIFEGEFIGFAFWFN